MYYTGYTPYGIYPYEPGYYVPYGYGRRNYGGFWLGLAVVLLILLFLFGGYFNFNFD